GRGGGDRRGRGGDPGEPPPGLEEDPRGDRDRDPAPEPADARNRFATVNARTVRLVVDAADPGGEPDHERRQRKDDSSRGQEAPDRVAVAKERVQRAREGHQSGYTSRLCRNPAPRPILV